MPHAAPSALVQQKLAILDRRIVLGRRLNRLTMLVVSLVTLHLVLFGLSLWPGLHTFGLRCALAGFAGLTLGLLVWIGYPRRRLDERMLAALIEKHYPELGEKLLSSVEVSQNSEPHGGIAFIDQLAHTTDRQLDPLDPRAVHSLRRPMRGAVLAGCGVAVAVLLFALSPRYARFCERFFTAWSNSYAGYHLEVSPGDAWSGRGRPATVEARLTLLEDDESLPAECFVVYAHEDGPPQRVRMDRASADTFLFSWPRLEHDVTYRVAAGELSAGPFHLVTVKPVELASTPRIRITPPPYVTAAPTLSDGGPVSALQYSHIRVELCFTARPLRATLKVRDASGTDIERALPLNENGQSAVEWPADQCGTFAATLLIEGDHGIMTTHTLPGWTIRPDSAPHFMQPIHLRGVRDQVLRAKEHLVAPDDPLRVQAVVEDAEGLSGVALEYRLNDGPIVALPWADTAGDKHVAIDRVLALPSGMKAGERLRFRLRAADNRVLAQNALGAGVPAAALTPQVVYSPAAPPGEERWVDLQVGKSTDSLLRQEIAEQHGELERQLEQVRQKLQKEHGLLGQVRQASHQQAEVRPAQLQQLAEAGRLNQAAVDALDQLASKLADTAELAPLADHLLGIAEKELAEAAQAMAQFQGRDRSAAERAQDGQAGEAAVMQAMQKLNELARLADRLARGRLDRLAMERLALKEQELAQRAEELLRAGAPTDPAMAKALAELQAEQERIAAELRELGRQSEMLQEAMAQAQAKRLAEQAGQIAKDQRAEMQGGPEGKGSGASKNAEKLEHEMKQLADDTLKLAQQGGPEAKQMAKDAAHAAEQARQAMEQSQADKAQGKPAEAKAMAAEALLKLELAQKGLEGLAGKMPGPGDEKLKTAEALAQGQKLIQAAQQKLQAQPSQAPKTMRQAAGSLDRAAQQISQQLNQALPKAAGRPAVGAGGVGKGGRLSLPAPLAKKLEPFQGKSWGELPGELKTQLLQDARAHFGDDYAAIIQQYFEQIAGAEPPRKAKQP